VFLVNVFSYILQGMMMSVLMFGSVLVHEILPKLCAAFINADGVSDDLGRTSSSVGELAALHPCRLESRHRVDRIKKTQEPNSADWPRERLPEALHEAEELARLVVYLGIIVLAISATALPLGKCLPRKLDHFLVAVRQESNVV
jgi:hypothetical protein